MDKSEQVIIRGNYVIFIIISSAFGIGNGIGVGVRGGGTPISHAFVVTSFTTRLLEEGAFVPIGEISDGHELSFLYCKVRLKNVSPTLFP